MKKTIYPKGFQQLLPVYMNPGFTGRLMRLITQIKRHDTEGKRGRRSILFSAARPLLQSICWQKSKLKD